MIVKAEPSPKSMENSTSKTSSPFRWTSWEARSEPTVIQTRDLIVGGGNIGYIAGPCAVESREQIIEIAQQVKEAGATALRGGAYKPRTSPYSFQGLKEEGLKLLAEAREETGLAIVTEVMAPEDVDHIAGIADVLQVGARNMQNYPLLAAVGRVKTPVLLKRGPSATMEELLYAAEHVMCQGNRQVMLCERGIRTFEDHVRFTLALSSVPWLHQQTHLPVIVDPSHGTGHANLVTVMARAAIAAGADGLLVEVHSRPEEALSDGQQALRPTELERLMHECQRIAEVIGKTTS